MGTTHTLHHIVLSVCVALVATKAPAEVLAIPTYAEVSQEAGIDHQFTGGWEFSVGGGAAAFDCNGDALADLFLAGGEGEAGLYINTGEIGGPLAFVKADPGDIGALVDVVGAYPLDIDGDGQIDLALPRVGENLLLKGLGNCKFSRANEDWQFDGGNAWSTGFTAAWEAGAIFPTLVFGNYVDRSVDGGEADRCHGNSFHRPTLGARPNYSNPLMLKPGRCSLSVLFTDWDNSGRLSLRMANDRQYYGEVGEEQLWEIPPGAEPRLYSRRDGWEELQIWGMGIAEADINGDGMPEYAITSMADNKLQVLSVEDGDQQPKYTDIALKSNTLAHRPYTGDQTFPSTAWHAEFVDLNNDGLHDLYLAKGNVEEMPNFAAFDPDNILLGQPDGTFVEVGDKAGVAIDRKGRGATFADFNLDGQVDFVVVNRRQQVSVFEGNGLGAALGNWIKVDLKGAEGNRNAIGAKIRILAGGREIRETVSVGGGHASGEYGFTHLGIGDAQNARVHVQWPNLAGETTCDAPANGILSMFMMGNMRCKFQAN